MSSELFTQLYVEFDNSLLAKDFIEKDLALPFSKVDFIEKDLAQPFSKVDFIEKDLALPFSKEDLAQPFLKEDLALPFLKEDLALPFSKVDFGLLTLNAVTSSLTKKNIELFFQIDCSGSMSDRCSDGRTKMQHILHTLRNMILFFKEHPLNIFVTIHAFDDSIFKIVDRTPVNNDTYEKIIASIDSIYPRGSTNIEKALFDVKKYFSSSEFPSDSVKLNILMTDGQPTAGNTSHLYLHDLVDINITNIFIGFGTDHDALLLNTISNNNYYFIDKLENAGLVYGEILHGVVYKFLENVEVSVTNGVIYDYKTNTWNTTLHVGDIAGESTQFYQVVSYNSDFALKVTGNKVDNVSKFILEVPVKEELTDLTKYIYRQRTQQLLFKIKKYNKTIRNEIEDFNLRKKGKKEQKEEKEQLNTEMATLFDELKKYMTDNNLLEDVLLKNLCDDIYICRKTFGTELAYMYCSARETSQGQQRAYTATHLPIDIEYPRQNAFADDEDLSIQIPEHDVSYSTQTPYRSKTMTQIMQSVSGRDEETQLE